MRENSEKTGPKFQLDSYLEARDLCQKIVLETGARLEAGMSEIEGRELLEKSFRELGVQRFWHPTKFRFGADSVKTFRAPPDPNLRLSRGDIFFFDVGPVIGDHEADFGQTFLFDPIGGQENKSPLVALQGASQKIWKETAKKWKTQGIRGVELFQEAKKISQSFGLDLNEAMAGHRLGDFPHAIHSKQNLFSLEFTPSAHLWVLEIHVLDPSLGRGSFYEDILF